MNSYELSRKFFDWCFENPEKVNTNHVAIYFFAIEHCNRLGWRDKFGYPTQMVMDAVGIKKHQTYIKYFNELCEFGFFKLIQKSQNQYSANIISLQVAMPKNGKALDKAIINHTAKQTQTIGQSNSSIDKPYNHITNNKITIPTIDLVKEYFKTNGYNEELAIKAFNYYDSAEWKDSNGKKVLNWKQKMQSVWFKDENKKSTNKVDLSNPAIWRN